MTSDNRPLDASLASQDFRILCFWNNDILSDIDPDALEIRGEIQGAVAKND